MEVDFGAGPGKSRVGFLVLHKISVRAQRIPGSCVQLHHKKILRAPVHVRERERSVIVPSSRRRHREWGSVGDFSSESTARGSAHWLHPVATGRHSRTL